MTTHTLIVTRLEVDTIDTGTYSGPTLIVGDMATITATDGAIQLTRRQPRTDAPRIGDEITITIP